MHQVTTGYSSAYVFHLLYAGLVHPRIREANQRLQVGKGEAKETLISNKSINHTLVVFVAPFRRLASEHTILTSHRNVD